MAEMFGNRKNKIPIKKSDLNQAILKRNDKLDAKNKILDDNIKNKESEIKSLDKEIKSLNNEVKSISKDVSNSKNLLSKENLKLNNMLSDMSKDIKDRKSHVLTLKNEESSINKNVEKLNKEALELKEDATLLLVKNKEKEDLIQDVDYFQKQKELNKNELDKIQGEYRSIEDKIYNEELRLNVISKGHQEKIDKMSNEYEENLKKNNEANKNLVDAKNAHTDFINNSKKEKEEKSLELKTIESLLNKQEDEYIVWERKIENIQKSAEVEESRISKTKKHFENWKINALEEVARMKLKRKIEIIDKAGLQEILNG